MIHAIEAIGLRKQFPAPPSWLGIFRRAGLPRPAVNGVDLTVQQGELFGLLGPNGAGKTTLIKLLTTLVEPSGGTAFVMGHELGDAAGIKRCIGLAASDERSFYWRLSGRQNLEFFGALQNLPAGEIGERIERTLAQVGLEDAADQRFQTYSTGMRQRLAIARAILHQPSLLFLDEPTKGLDPTAARQLHLLVRQLVETQGITVFLTTHILAEAEQLCQRVAVMHRGQIRGCGAMSELRQELGLRERFRVEAIYPEAVVPASPRSAAQPAANEIHCAAENLDLTLAQIQAQNGRIVSVEKDQASLETIFAALTDDESPLPPAAHRLPATRPRPHSSPTHKTALGRVAGAFLRKDFLEEASYRAAFLLQFSGIFISLIIFYYLSQLMGSAAESVLGKLNGGYFAFVLVGLAFSSYFNLGINSFADNLRRAQTTGTLEAMLATPTPLTAIVLASAQWSFFVTTLRVAIILSIGLPLTEADLGAANLPAALLVLVLTLLAFSSLGILAASFIMVLKRGDPITWAMGIISTVFGGVYFPAEVLPGWMQAAAQLLPITYGLRAMRAAVLQGASLAELWPELAALLVFCALLFPLSLLAFRYAVNRARVEGSLTHY